jgi:hypothetical protein
MFDAAGLTLAIIEVAPLGMVAEVLIFARIDTSVVAVTRLNTAKNESLSVAEKVLAGMSN